MHAHKNSLVECRHQSRTLTASPVLSPQIPPRPNFIQYNQSFQSFNAPSPPPRSYQIIPICDSIKNQTKSKQPSNRNNYENIQETFKPVVVIRDPRRKPYYYNELHQNLNDDFIEQDSKDLDSTKLGSEENILNEYTIRDNSEIREKFTTEYGSGGSLDYIF